MYKYQKQEKKYCYVIYDELHDGIPVACVDTLDQICQFIGCCMATTCRMLYTGSVVRSFSVCKVML